METDWSEIQTSLPMKQPEIGTGKLMVFISAGASTFALSLKGLSDHR
jgi:hypothetical protein